MTKNAILLGCLSLAACATASQRSSPAATYHSARAVDAIADCVMDRTASADFRVHRESAGDATRVRVTGFAGTYFLFTLQPSPGGGTDVEIRRLNSVAPGLHNAETCF